MDVPGFFAGIRGGLRLGAGKLEGASRAGAGARAAGRGVQAPAKEGWMGAPPKLHEPSPSSFAAKPPAPKTGRELERERVLAEQLARYDGTVHKLSTEVPLLGQARSVKEFGVVGLSRHWRIHAVKHEHLSLAPEGTVFHTFDLGPGPKLLGRHVVGSAPFDKNLVYGVLIPPFR